MLDWCKVVRIRVYRQISVNQCRICVTLCWSSVSQLWGFVQTQTLFLFRNKTLVLFKTKPLLLLESNDNVLLKKKTLLLLEAGHCYFENQDIALSENKTLPCERRA